MTSSRTKNRTIDYRPEDVLVDTVRSAVKAMAKSIGRNKTFVYSIFAGQFETELSQWCTGNRDTIESQIEFTDRLIGIVTGTVAGARIEHREDYDKVLDAIKADELLLNSMSDLAAYLKKFRDELMEKNQSTTGMAATHEFAAAVSELRRLRTEIPANGAQAGRGKAAASLRPFPDHIEQIVALVESAKESLVIQTDAVDYGSFRDMESHRRLFGAILRSSARVKKVEFLVWLDRQPMSWANRFRKPEKRNDWEFVRCVEKFCDALKSSELADTEEYKNVLACLGPGVDWAAADGEIQKLLDLQLKFHDAELKKLHAADVKPVFRSRKPGLEILGTAKDEPPEGPFFWIADRSRGIFVYPRRGEDASASEVTDGFLLDETLKNFYDRFFYVQSSENGGR